jgi:hypothetical protein
MWISEARVSPERPKGNLRRQINGKCNDISSTDEINIKR